MEKINIYKKRGKGKQKWLGYKWRGKKVGYLEFFHLDSPFFFHPNWDENGRRSNIEKKITNLPLNYYVTEL